MFPRHPHDSPLLGSFCCNSYPSSSRILRATGTLWCELYPHRSSISSNYIKGMKAILFLRILLAGLACATSLFPPEDTFDQGTVASQLSLAFNDGDLDMLDTWIRRVDGPHRKTITASVRSSVGVDVRKSVFGKVLASRIQIAHFISMYNLLDDIALYDILKEWTAS